MQDHIETQQERLTAYALNELDRTERDAIEAQLKNDPEAQRYVDDIRATATLLETELKQERLEELARTLGTAKPAPVVAKPAARNATVRPKRKPWNRFLAYGTAAAAMVALGLVMINKNLKGSPGSEMRVAESSPAPLQSSSADDTYDTKEGPGLSRNEGDDRGSFNIRGGSGRNILTDKKNSPKSKEVARNFEAAKSETSTSEQTPKAIAVPPPILKTAELGDHFETINLDRPDEHRAFHNVDLVPIKVAPAAKARDEADVSKTQPMGFRDVYQKTLPLPEKSTDVKKTPDFTIGSRFNGPEGLMKKAAADESRPVAATVPPASKSGEKIEGGKFAYDRTMAKKPVDELPTVTEQPSTDLKKVEAPAVVNSYTVMPPAPPPVKEPNETYNVYPENGFESVRTSPLSTFSADVDTASFSNVRRFLTLNQLPPIDAVRTEELINYFKYHYDTMKSDDPFGVNVEAAACPWNAANRLVRVAIKATNIAPNQRPTGNFVFLIDVSGSMDEPNRLPLVKDGLKALVRKLDASDRVTIVTYAGQSGVALPATSGSNQARIIGVIDSLVANGGTNGGEGIQTAYAAAKANFIKGGVNRVILATDGDFNVGISSTDALVKLIEAQSDSGVFLTALGYGMGNLKDAMLQKLADKGNGNYAYIDTAEESRKVLVEQMTGTLMTVAKDVKFQVEFNPANAVSYRLIGYEKRSLAAHDFNNDAKDAGEVGAGHTVTAFYEVVPANGAQPGVDPLKYQNQPTPDETKPVDASSELLTLKIRYKQPESNTSKRLEFAFKDRGARFEQASEDFKFGSAVALFGQMMKHSPHVQNIPMQRVIELADDNRGADEGGYRKEFIQMARKAAQLRGER